MESRNNFSGPSTSTEIVRSSVNDVDLVGQNLAVDQGVPSNCLMIRDVNHLQLGTVVNFYGSPTSVPDDYECLISEEIEEFPKTRSISKMMKCTDFATPAFLDLVAGNLGRRWKEFTVLIETNTLYTERMEADYMIVMQVMTNYFRENQDKQTVGWLATFLYRNYFRRTLHTIKEPYELLKEVDSD